ncbi:hypothetical protein FN846DRAFT_948943 [Sphaerosporella brunnea]|uniref:Uncharacterized protein n=1 Tax=Sphaerosporella brunnea TaxID=1250544 RepID=A0A5J5EX93_9PEZI|nr:hypothetical protein FN846DRAFT_948943 [Sphaerosporella brunnea]
MRNHFRVFACRNAFNEALADSSNVEIGPRGKKEARGRATRVDIRILVVVFEPVSLVLVPARAVAARPFLGGGGTLLEMSGQLGGKVICVITTTMCHSIGALLRDSKTQLFTSTRLQVDAEKVNRTVKSKPQVNV